MSTKNDAAGLLGWYAGLLADEAQIDAARAKPTGGAAKDIREIERRLQNFRNCPYALTCEVGVSCGCAVGYR